MGAIISMHNRIASVVHHIVIPAVQKADLEFDDARSNQQLLLGMMTQVALPIKTFVVCEIRVPDSNITSFSGHPRAPIFETLARSFVADRSVTVNGAWQQQRLLLRIDHRKQWSAAPAVVLSPYSALEHL